MRRARLTIRARLTLVYGGLFLLAGVVLLAVTFALMSARLPREGNMEFHQQGSAPPPPESHAQLTQVAENTRENALAALLTQGGIALVLVSVTAIALGWLIAGRMLQPLHRITETARRIADSPVADRGLHDRIALAGPRDEVKELADTFDVMLEHLDRSFDGQRRFIANASHELRTPLTLNRALLEVAVHREPATPEVRQLGGTLLEINARHEKLIDGLLLLARSERDVVERSYVDLADIVEHVAHQLPSDGVAVHTEASEAPTTGDPVLLERLVQNLVENGIRHNVVRGGWVRVTSATDPDGTVSLRVSNTGPVVPGYEVASLSEPFRRLHTERQSGSPGSGLGLSIVAAVAAAHRGQVHAEPHDDGGLIVTVTLPAAADASACS
ncbi:signal transduction histidine kinase [Herbihabitans rhizosphaerae]|uniref:histidine kinase n=1 Tax=Herbihabitans rhizosphaerae TaxID=1872711 RepID=A0A4Q7KN72_9PSEU|nr:HAMP domain-containing sensor histidine kinase [Herbihabitans rhizosphaerae]RZS37757.1 signal transduction histidine kinase [Herbihabitans rhizosphaerae]